jgi:hypothetical protein
MGFDFKIEKQDQLVCLIGAKNSWASKYDAYQVQLFWLFRFT